MNTATAPKGLIHSLLLKGMGGARALSWPNIADRSPEQGCLWLHFYFEDEDEVSDADDKAFGMVVTLCIGLILILAALFRRKQWI
jgi:hypothetical protein